MIAEGTTNMPNATTPAMATAAAIHAIQITLIPA